VPGRTYQIVLDSFFGLRLDYTLNFLFEPRPANDYFANRIQLTGSAASVTSSNVLGTQELGEPSHGFVSGRSLWWSWTAPGSGLVSLDTSGSGITAVLGVYTGTNLSQLTSVTNGTTAISFSSVAGTTYQIAVDQWGALGNGGEVRLSLILSTLRIVAPTNGMVFYGPTNVALSIERTALDGELVGVDLFDNDALAVSNAASLTSIVLSNAPIGSHTVRVRATSRDNVIRWSPPITFTVIPANDDFASRPALSGVRVTVNGVTIGASKEPGEPNHTGYSGGQSCGTRGPRQNRLSIQYSSARHTTGQC
jgi:hypothetical protein